ncbi:MAG: NADP-dependent oxidoreductase [Deltaproteobacteria bacterium]|nr:NADP-dependent oxidoreductase [Deltaproteobacteria bacterium]
MQTAHEIPSEMKAAAIDRFGLPEVIHTETLPVPRLGKNEILVEVAVAGVGSWDPALVDGSFQDAKRQFPIVFGSDGAGTVAAVGSGVKRFAVGDRVYGWGFGNPKGGFFAEYVAIKERDAAHIPETVPFEEAGALAVAGVTALQGLEALDLEPGQDIIIFGASGGVGHVAIQLAKRLGLRVFAVASKADGVALAEQLGADGVADGHGNALGSQASAFAPDGFHGALVLAGGDNGWKEELKRVTKGGVVAWPNGVEPVPATPKGLKRKPYDGEDSPKTFDRLNALIATGPFHIELSKIYPLDKAAQALRDVQHHHVGKLAVRVHR